MCAHVNILLKTQLKEKVSRLIKWSDLIHFFLERVWFSMGLIGLQFFLLKTKIIFKKTKVYKKMIMFFSFYVYYMCYSLEIKFLNSSYPVKKVSLSKKRGLSFLESLQGHRQCKSMPNMAIQTNSAGDALVIGLLSLAFT